MFDAGFASPTVHAVGETPPISHCEAAFNDPPAAKRPADWLLDASAYKAAAKHDEQTGELTLANGLVTRTLRLKPNAATVGLRNEITQEELIRSVRPEARVALNGAEYAVGGLVGQRVHNYLLPEWIDNLKSDPAAFQFESLEIGKIEPRFAWMKQTNWLAEDIAWPPPGVHVTLKFAAPKGEEAQPKIPATVEVHYEIYDGLPLLCKWIVVHNDGVEAMTLNRFASEILAVVEAESTVEPKERWRRPAMHVETDFAFASMEADSGNKHVVHWRTDPLYESQVHYRRETPCLLEVSPAIGPEQTIEPGEEFVSQRTWELLFDSEDRQRRGLALARMYRTIAPWVCENPLIMHVRSAHPEAVKLAIDQAAEVGFELVIMTFGSGFNIENLSNENIETYRRLVEYAKSKNIALGGYSLLSSRSAGPNHDVIDVNTGKPGGAVFGSAPCICSEWGQDYFAKLYQFFEKTGLMVFEHDGSYPGDSCASTTHPGHKGHGDSQWNQHRTISKFYQWCRGRGVYLNVPDWYYLSGSSKCGMGYRETNWSLPRHQQEIIERQNIYDGTLFKRPSMGWMFVPLTEYHGGGPAATIEPLHQNLDHYEARLANLLGAGVQACYRGPRIYDTDETKAVVKKWVDWYKKYRTILDADIVHGRRADGRDIDWLLHVNPNQKMCGLAMVYNPLDREVERTLRLPLYYTGLTDVATIREREGEPKPYKLERDYTVEVTVKIPARGRTWLVVERE